MKLKLGKPVASLGIWGLKRVTKRTNISKLSMDNVSMDIVIDRYALIKLTCGWLYRNAYKLFSNNCFCAIKKVCNLEKKFQKRETHSCKSFTEFEKTRYVAAFTQIMIDNKEKLMELFNWIRQADRHQFNFLFDYRLGKITLIQADTLYRTFCKIVPPMLLKARISCNGNRWDSDQNKKHSVHF